MFFKSFGQSFLNSEFRVNLPLQKLREVVLRLMILQEGIVLMLLHHPLLYQPLMYQLFL